MLPDFRNTTSYDEIAALFQSTAQTIMLDFELVFGIPELWRMNITSLELYLHSKVWPDPNCDKSCEQLKSGTWYVKLVGDNANRSRIDITCGTAASTIYAGMLIRALNYTDGSAKALKHIIRGRENTPLSWGSDEIDLLKRDVCGQSIFTGLLRLEKRTSNLLGTVEPAARHGLRKDEFPWTKSLRMNVASRVED